VHILLKVLTPPGVSTPLKVESLFSVSILLRVLTLPRALTLDVSMSRRCLLWACCAQLSLPERVQPLTTFVCVLGNTRVCAW